MSTTTNIEWTDTTWNVTAGCTRVSVGCRNCYAERMSQRLAAMAGKDLDDMRNPGRKGHYVNVVKYAECKPGSVREPVPLPQWNNKVVCVEEALDDPLRWKKPRRVFVNSMSDLFHPDVPFDFIDRVFAVMAVTPQHTYQILTKRPERMAEYLTRRPEDDEGWAVGSGLIQGIEKVFEDWDSGKDDLINEIPLWDESEGFMPLVRLHERGGLKLPLTNVWLGTSVEDQAAADARIPHLLRCPAAVRFLSCEPLLGPVDLTRITQADPAKPGEDTVEGWYLDALAGDAWDDENRSLTSEYRDTYGTARLNWVIVGGESGPNARPMHPSWARSLRDQCVSAGVAYFFKQWGEWKPTNGSNGYTQASPDKPCYGNAVGLAILRDGRHVLRDIGPSQPNQIVDLQASKDLHAAMEASDKLPPWPKGPEVHDWLGYQWMHRLGKKAAGRQLDGRTWDQMPQIGGGK